MWDLPAGTAGGGRQLQPGGRPHALSRTANGVATNPWHDGLHRSAYAIDGPTSGEEAARRWLPALSSPVERRPGVR